MHRSLFREEVIKHQCTRLEGEVLVTPALSQILITMGLLTWVLALIAWLVSSQYTRKVSVSGWLEPSKGVIQLTPRDNNGRIGDVFVKEGQWVNAGAPLLEINADRILSDGKSLQDQMRREYLAQKGLLEERLDALKAIGDLQITELLMQQKGLELDHARLLSQIETLAERISMLDKRSAHFSSMQREGHVSNLEMESVHEQALALKNESQALHRERVKIANRLDQLKIQRQRIPTEQDNAGKELKAQISSLNQQLSQLNAQKTHVLRASVDGTVTNLQARQGQHLSSDKPLLSLLPSDTSMQAKLLVPVRSAGFLSEGQELDIRYEAFPYQKFGLYKGKVTDVSQTVLLPSEILGSPINASEPVFVIKAQLQLPYVVAYGRNVSLKPGMTLSADIKQDSRSLMEWLLEPALTLRGYL